MSSAEQITANRRNGGLSNGPKTANGKAASSKNALKHGLLSREVVLRDEDATEFDAFAQGIESQMKPQGELERALVLRIVGLLWRLRRAGKLEAAILFWEQRKFETDTLSQFSAYRRISTTLPRGGELAILGGVYLSAENSLAKLSRYESTIQRNFLRMLHELQRLQAAREGEHVPPPQAVDIDVTGLPEPTCADDQLPLGK